jgi:hypothetical protein
VRRLMLAMLVDAVRCSQSNAEGRRPAKRREFEEAQAWIVSDDDNGFFSFSAACSALEIDPKAVRKGFCAGSRQTVQPAQTKEHDRSRSPRPAVTHEARNYLPDSSRRPWLWRC